MFVAAVSTRSQRRFNRMVASSTAAPHPAGTHGDRRQSLAPIPSPLLLELVAALLESGAPPSTALRHISSALARVGDRRALPLESLAVAIEQGVVPTATATTRISSALGDARGPRRAGLRRRLQLPGPRSHASRSADDAGLAVLRDAVRMATAAGLPPAELVRRAAAEERRRAAAVRQRAIRRLEVLLVLPVGLCLLPAFVLLGIVPVIVDLLTG
jgi:hypothetical protein